MSYTVDKTHRRVYIHIIFTGKKSLNRDAMINCKQTIYSCIITPSGALRNGQRLLCGIFVRYILYHNSDENQYS